MKTTKRNIKQAMLTIIPAMGMFFLLLVLGSCKGKTGEEKGLTQEDVREEIEEAADTTAAYLSEEKEELVKSYQVRVDEAEAQIENMKQKIESAGQDIKQDYRQRVEELESRIAEVNQEIDQLESSSEEAWKELTAGVDSAVADLDQAITDAKSAFN